MSTPTASKLAPVALAVIVGLLAAVLSFLSRGDVALGPPGTFTLAITIDGAGRIDSINDKEIHCPPDCSEVYKRIEGPHVGPFTEAHVIAYPDARARFLGWSGPACVPADQESCLLLMDRHRTITAHFSKTGVIPSLSITKVGNGSGHVLSTRVPVDVEKVDSPRTGHMAVEDDPRGIDCGHQCRAEYESGAELLLLATPDAGSTFRRWAGAGADCIGRTNPFCFVRVEGADRVTAEFSED